jgi:hypothetical protein
VRSLDARFAADLAAFVRRDGIGALAAIVPEVANELGCRGALEEAICARVRGHRPPRVSLVEEPDA